MKITREMLQAQRAHAVAERDGFLAKVNAQVGAINVFDHLLALLDQPEPPPPPPGRPTT